MEKNTLESALKEFSQTSGTNANDVKEFFALMSDGSIKRMPKEDMATVLGGLIDMGIIQSSANWNDIKKMGVYQVAGVLGENAPVENSYGILRVYNSGGSIVQEFTPYLTTGKIYIRILYGSWTPWSVFRGVNI